MADERLSGEPDPDFETDPRPTAEIDRTRHPDLPEQRNSRLAWVLLAIAVLVAVVVMALGYRSGV